MNPAIEALLPITAAIFTGYWFCRYGSVKDDVWAGISHLVYFLFMPALQIHVLANKPLAHLPWQELLFTIVLTLVTCSLLLLGWQRWGRRLEPATFTSLFQGGIRFNTFIALVVADAIYGEQGLLIGALAAAVMIVLINILCVSVFACTLGGAGVDPRAMARQLLSNPLIIGCLVGLGLNFSGIGLHGPPAQFFELLGRAAFPLGLMAVGAGLRLEQLRGDWELITVSSLFQFLIKPLLAFALAEWVGLNGVAAAVVVLFLAIPTAPSAYILARQLGGDHQAMASIITAQTLLALVTLPLTLNLLGISS